MINFIDVLLRVGSVIFSAMNFQRNQNNHSRVEYNCKWIHNNRSNWLPEACYSQKNIDYALSCLDQFTWIGKKWVGNMTKNPAPFKFVDCFLTTNNIDVQQHIPLNEMSKNVALIPLALSLVTVVGYLFRSTFEHSFQKQEDNERNYLNSANDDVQDPITSESPLLEGKKEGNFLFRATSCSHLGHIIELICSLFLIGVASYGIHYLHNNTWRPSAPFQNIYYDTYCSCLYRSGISGFLEFPLQICAFTRTC